MGFIAVNTEKKINRKRPRDYSDKLRIIYQPELSNLKFKLHSNGTITSFGGMIANLFIKTTVFCIS